MSDPLKGNDGKLGQDYMRAIVGAALGSTARFGVKNLAETYEDWNRYPHDRYNYLVHLRGGYDNAELTAQSWNYDKYNWANDVGPKSTYGFNKGMSTTTTMTKPKTRRSVNTYYHATDRRNYRKKRYFGFQYKKW